MSRLKPLWTVVSFTNAGSNDHFVVVGGGGGGGGGGWGWGWGWGGGVFLSKIVFCENADLSGASRESL
jgi:hypothetical protein